MGKGQEGGAKGDERVEIKKGDLSRWAVKNGAQARDQKNGLSERRRSAFPFFRVP